MAKNALLLYPNQLFAVEFFTERCGRNCTCRRTFIVWRRRATQNVCSQTEVNIYACVYALLYGRRTMAGPVIEVDYIEFHHLTESGDIVEKLKQFDEVEVFEVNDDVLSRRLLTAIEAHPEGPEVQIIKSPNFYLSVQDCNNFFANKKKSSFLDFYQWQRERFNILIDQKTYKPLEGKWNHKTNTSKRLPKNHTLPSFQVYGSNDFVSEATDYVNKNFPDNPGLTDDFPWPTSRQEANAWLQEFLKHRLEKYGNYIDAIDGEAPWLYHSGISLLLNAGLLHPQTVVDSAISYSKKENIPTSDVEVFVRQIVGWREYSRALYQKYHVVLRTANTYQHNRRMTNDWYMGTTGLPPVDDVVRKVQDRSYTHNAERLMILGNIMFLCEFHPDDVYRWFMEMFIDSHEWVTLPNVYGFSQGAPTIPGNGPTISNSSSIISMSHYEKGRLV